MKKFFVLLMVVAFGVGLVGCGSEAAVAPVIRTVEANSPVGARVITVRGVVESIESRNVYSTLGLSVERVYVEEGDAVRAGQVLAVLDTTDLELAIAQQKATLEATRQGTEHAVRETRRMLAEAEANLARNTNMHILGAEAALNGAVVNLEISQLNYDNAVRDYADGSNPHVMAAASGVTAVRTELSAMETTFANVQSLYESGVASRDDLRQAETGITHLRNQYADASRALDAALDAERRIIEQLRTGLSAAIVTEQNARALLSAATSAANQEIDMLRGSLVSAELAANLEPLEIAIQLMERQMEDAILTAPIDGTVTARIANEGSIGMGLMFVVADTENLRVITGFREYDIASISLGMDVSIFPDGASGTHTGTISRISPSASPFIPVPTFETEIQVTQASSDLRIGMSARIEVKER